VAGRKGDALRIIDELQTLGKREFLPVAFEGFVRVGLGDIDGYFRCAEQSLADRSLDIVFLRYSPLMSPVRADPRYRQLIERLRLD
jgi:hypothetical protein